MRTYTSTTLVGVNSTSLDADASALLDNGFVSIEAQKEWRRQRLAELIDEIGEAQLAEITGIAAAQLYQMSKGRDKNKRPVTDKTAHAIELKAGRQGWFTYPGAHSAPTSDSNDSEHADDVFEDVGFIGLPAQQVPIVGSAALGFDGFGTDWEYPAGHGDGYVDHNTKDKNAYALRVKGDSMYPAIRSGYIVAIEPNTTPVVGEFVMVKLKDGRSTVKELLWHRNGEYALQAVNGETRLTVAEEDIEKIHYVAAILPPSRRRF